MYKHSYYVGAFTGRRTSGSAKMTKSMLLMSAAAMSAALASPALADIIQVDTSSIQGREVLFNVGQQSGNSVNGFLNDKANTSVTFTGAAGAILRANGGQSQITGDLDNSTPQPNDTIPLLGMTFGLTDNSTFNNVEFSLFKGSATNVNFSLVNESGQTFTFDNLALGVGENKFGFQAINGQSIRSVSFDTLGGGIQDVRQVRLGLTNAVVPEPAAWALMLAGFSMVGSAMRRRQRTTVTFA